ncbi:hypothetical protein FZEAL_6253 [Fusarium zealandicum]|uniref:Small secreted protein n=1 Tax=Fusarium zealandicum TaxID=1053134 RepID=A0A8H4UIX5_9HYPO|nr:hypothetical protein FZEAL_6253 [Fusarium zealandicum]
MQSNILALFATMVAMTNAVSIHVCTGKEFSEECTDVVFAVTDCGVLPFNDGISSFKLNGYTCSFYTDKECGGQTATFYADERNLREGTWNDQFTTVKCA